MHRDTPLYMYNIDLLLTLLFWNLFFFINSPCYEKYEYSTISVHCLYLNLNLLIHDINVGCFNCMDRFKNYTCYLSMCQQLWSFIPNRITHDTSLEFKLPWSVFVYVHKEQNYSWELVDIQRYYIPAVSGTAAVNRVSASLKVTNKFTLLKCWWSC